jgi:hypothetical protein
MKKILLATVALTMLSALPAEAQYYRRGPNLGPAIIFGAITAITGAIIASQRGYGPGPYYGSPPPNYIDHCGWWR